MTCTHEDTYPDPDQPFLTHCNCNHVRFGTCGFCHGIINLTQTSFAWPYVCVGCRKPACVRCANELARRPPAGIACHRCIPAESAPAQQWTVVYRISFFDRDKRYHNTIRPLPALFRTRDSAAHAALDYAQTMCPSVLTESTRLQFTEAMRKQFNGWFNADEVTDGYSILKMEIGLFGLHEAGTGLLPVPSALPETTQ